MNVMGIMQQIMSNNRVMGNPMIQNAMSMAQSGNSKGIEQMARNLCKEKGINPDDVMKQINKAYPLDRIICRLRQSGNGTKENRR